jgi:hypothetical protein
VLRHYRGEKNANRRADANRAFGIHASAVRFGHVLHDGQPESAAA